MLSWKEPTQSKQWEGHICSLVVKFGFKDTEKIRGG